MELLKPSGLVSQSVRPYVPPGVDTYHSVVSTPTTQVSTPVSTPTLGVDTSVDTSVNTNNFVGVNTSVNTNLR